MEFQFEAPKGIRVLGHLGIGITVECDHTYMTWCLARRQWFTNEETYTETSRRTGEPNCYISSQFSKGGSSHAPCRSFKAFKRHVRRHADKLKGCKVIYCHRYIGHDVVVQL